MNVDGQRLRQDRQILEVDLLLEVLRAGRDQDALPAEDGRHEVRHRLAGAGAGFGQQDAAVREDIGDAARHLALSVARLELIDRPRQRTVVGERVVDRRAQVSRSG